MNGALHKLYKPALATLALLLLAAAGLFQQSLNRLRADPELGLTRVKPLENAPPVLAFTTVALGGFRGLIANVLWIRANDLQMEGKYFEMVQLADWITKLEPHFSTVWIHQAWNMTYNISVKFDGINTPEDRWRWVKRGIELLRDQALLYNPKEALLYRELGWFFQHKIGQNLDDAHLYYKTQWAREMESVLGGGRPDFPSLIHPASEDATNRVRRLREVYKMDPQVMQDVDTEYGPLDWRLPEAHAIYWAHLGLANARPKDLITLRRVIYQSMVFAALRGRLWFVETKDGQSIRLGPNLQLADKANEAFEKMIADEKEMAHAIRIPHRNFLQEMVELMYVYNRPTDANRWLALTRATYPDAVPPNVSAEELALSRLTGELGDLNHDRTKAVIEGLLVQSLFSLAIGEHDRSAGLQQMAIWLWTHYDSLIGKEQHRLALPPLPEMLATVRDEMLAPGGWDPLLAARLRTELGLPPLTNEPPEQPSPAPR